MRHPFAGVNTSETTEVSKPSRRSLFGMVAGAVAAGTAGLLAFGGSSAEAQRGITTLAIGEEGGRPPRPVQPSTRMVGEEGGRRPRGWKK